ncbi:hypothetical protein [Pararhodobacter zhoushanensis]|uniref:Uncharacterized protein n=1 Tax=Pararhodobacter zhoushanensis TaxID=2479545 RepID=A0ABT3GX73_9RHOB|nr:hypothetical protein [Pararhodobacter zhoushanensis]MCW1932116.1 hypothetical protein [Pararhodobacter zhoushanensis]
MTLTPYRALVRALGAAAFVALAAPSVAQDLHADDTSFNLFNDTARGVDSFAVMMPAGGYSNNWLAQRMVPGTGLTLQFPFDMGGQCDLKTRITYEDGSIQELIVTYCGTAAVFLENTGIRFD